MDKDAVIDAERTLFGMVYDGKNIFSDTALQEIRRIIAVYIQDNNVQDFMCRNNLNRCDFEYIYDVLLYCTEYFEYFYVGELKCLFPTAVLLDEKVIDFMESYFQNYHKFENIFWKDFLTKTAMEGAELFFRREAVRQNIVERDYYILPDEKKILLF